MVIPISTTIAAPFHEYLIEQSRLQKTTQRVVIEQALKAHRKDFLRAQVTAGFQERTEEYKNLANDFREAQIKSLQE